MASILVVGCVSLDTIHLEQKGPRQSHDTVGGAAFFTALAAAREGATVTLYAPKPHTMPEALSRAAGAITWIGPATDIKSMPRLEIVHHGQGRATLLHASWGPEQLLQTDNLATELQKAGKEIQSFDAIHVAALSSAQRQLDFLRYFARSSAKSILSAGTYARAINQDKAAVLQLLQESNVFFMNNNEARLLFDGSQITASESQQIFVTDGENGSTLYSGTFEPGAQHIDATKAEELDPTGAGDTFCGATLAALAAHNEPRVAGQKGSELAARIIEHAGSSYYFAP